MPLTRIGEFDPNYREAFDGNALNGLGVYAGETNEKIGTVSDVLVDEKGNFRYLVIDLGFWILGKKVLLPVGRSQIDTKANRVNTVGLTKQQAQALPEFSDRTTADYDYEERVRGVYRPPAGANVQPKNTYNRDTYTYQQDGSLYDMNDRDHQTLKLYEERLIANKNRVKTGEVAVGKHVETETAKVSVPIEKERVIIERVTPANAGKAVASGTVEFREGEVARMEVYEETADIHKEAFVREEVDVKKVVDRDIATAEETIRREELDVKTDGHSVVDRSNSDPNNRV
jgi:uncharacterized protein (TIGR02271 family)